MTRERRKTIFIFSILNLSVLLFSFLFFIIFKPLNIIERGKSYTCVFQSLFGLYCPGCGGTRSIAYLLRFDFLNSFIFYPPLFVFIFLYIFINFILIKSFKDNSTEALSKRRFFEFLLIPISIILTFLIRNIFLFFGLDLLGDILI